MTTSLGSLLQCPATLWWRSFSWYPTRTYPDTHCSLVLVIRQEISVGDQCLHLFFPSWGSILIISPFSSYLLRLVCPIANHIYRLSIFSPLLLLKLLPACGGMRVARAGTCCIALLLKKLSTANKVLKAYVKFIFISMTSQTSLAEPNDEITTCSEILNHFLNIRI